MIVDYAAAKAHLNLSDDVDEDLIESKIAAAQSFIESHLGYAIEDEYDTPPAALVEAVLQVVAHWYENREASLVGVTAQRLPTGVDDVLASFRSYSFGAVDE